jgi:selenoprotein W-related protein
LTSKLLSTYKQQISDMKLIPSGGGCFELSINGDLIYSKLKTGEFPDEERMVAAFGSRLKKS